MQAGEALDTLLSTDYVRRRTRQAIRAMWLPPTLFGALILLSLSLVGTRGVGPTTIYWLIAGPLGCLAVYLYYRERERRRGVGGDVLPEVVVAAALFVAAALLTGAGGFLHGPFLWWLYSPQVGWGLPVLGIVTIPPVGAPIAVTLGYAILALLKRSPRLLILAITLGVAIFAVGFVVLTIANKAALESVVTGPGGAGMSTLSHLGTTVAFRVAPTVAYALTLMVTGVLFRRSAAGGLV
jgi:hypothetical protein